MIIQIVWFFTWRRNQKLELSDSPFFVERGSGSEEKPVLYADSLEVGGLKFLRWVFWQTFWQFKDGPISKLWCGWVSFFFNDIAKPPDEVICIYIYPQPTWNFQWSQEVVMPSMNSLKFNWIRLCKVMRVSNTASPVFPWENL